VVARTGSTAAGYRFRFRDGQRGDWSLVDSVGIGDLHVRLGQSGGVCSDADTGASGSVANRTRARRSVRRNKHRSRCVNIYSDVLGGECNNSGLRHNPGPINYSVQRITKSQFVANNGLTRDSELLSFARMQSIAEWQQQRTRSLSSCHQSHEDNCPRCISPLRRCVWGPVQEQRAQSRPGRT
jgi:hypothetical protein